MTSKWAGGMWKRIILNAGKGDSKIVRLERTKSSSRKRSYTTSEEKGKKRAGVLYPKPQGVAGMAAGKVEV